MHCGSMVPSGLPLSSYKGKDGQSDSEALHLLNPAYLTQNRWDDLGVHVWQLKASLLCGQWTGTAGFNPEQLFQNAAVGNLDKFGSTFSSFCLFLVHVHASA